MNITYNDSVQFNIKTIQEAKLLSDLLEAARRLESKS